MPDLLVCQMAYYIGFYNYFCLKVLLHLKNQDILKLAD